MFTKKTLKSVESQPRTIIGKKPPAQAQTDPALGPFQLLPGVWRNIPSLPGRGWNMIALPFATAPGSPINYRLLLNQYNEELEFSLVDKGVPNRGIRTIGGTTVDADQLLVTLDYEQQISQIASIDFPESGKAGAPNLPIHHEPGLWLHTINEITDGLNIARLATIPHGDSVLAIGRSDIFKGPPVVPSTNGLPIGVVQDLANPYLEPYKHFHDAPFLGLFDPVLPHELLRQANQGVNIVRTTVLDVDTENATGGIVNVPFVVAQANASAMKSTFWIQEIEETANGSTTTKLRLQYLQTVFLDFFPRRDGLPGLIRWPHVSINTMEKVDPDTESPITY